MITLHEFKALTAAEKVEVYKRMLKGNMALELNRDLVPRGRKDPGKLSAMSPPQRSALYKSMLGSRP